MKNEPAKKAFRLIDREAQIFDADRDNYTVNLKTFREINKRLWASWDANDEQNPPCRWICKIMQLMGEDEPTEYFTELLEERAASIADGTAKEDLKAMYETEKFGPFEYAETVQYYNHKTDVTKSYGWMKPVNY